MLQFSSLISSQIRFLVESVNDANYDSIYRELRQFVEFGREASILLLQTCLGQVKYHGRDIQNLQVKRDLFSAIFKYVLEVPNFCSIFSEALGATLMSEGFLEDLSNMLNLSAAEKIGVGLALSESEILDFRTKGQNFSIAQIEELCANPTAAISNKQIQDVVLFLHRSEGLSKHVDSFTKILSLLPLKTSALFVQTPILSDDIGAFNSLRQMDLFFEFSDKDFESVLAEIEKEMSMADILRELGYKCTVNISHCKEMLSLFLPLNEATLSKLLGLIARTHIGLDDTQNIHSAFCSALDCSSSCESPLLRSWNVDVLVDAIMQLAPTTNWIFVMEKLDHEGFNIPDETSFSVLMSIYTKACKDPFPLHIICGSVWKNTEGQLSFLRQAVSAPPDVFTFMHCSRQLVHSDSTNLSKGNGNQAWSCLDLLNVLCQLAESGHISSVRLMLEHPLNQCPEVLLFGIAHINTPYNLLQYEVSSTVFPVILRDPTKSGIIHRLWQVNPHMVLRGFVDTSTHPNNLFIIVDICQDLKILSSTLQVIPFPVSIRLAAVAYNKEHLILEKWLSENMTMYKDSFFEDCLKYLKEILSDVEKDVSDSSSLQQSRTAILNIYRETCSVFFKVLQAYPGELSSRQSFEELKRLHILSSSRTQSPVSPNMSASNGRPVDLEEEANACFHHMFSRQLTIDDIVRRLAFFKESSEYRERAIFDCMIANIFEEYKFFPNYPDRQLILAAILFGSLIKHRLLIHPQLSVALRGVLDALCKSVDSKMFVFGTKALEQFIDRLGEWPQYCNHILQISNLRRGMRARLVYAVENSLALSSSRPAETNAENNLPAEQQLSSSAPTSSESMEVSTASWQLVSSTSSQLGQQLSSYQLQHTHPIFHADQLKPSATFVKNTEPLQSHARCLVPTTVDSVTNLKTTASPSLQAHPQHSAIVPAFVSSSSHFLCPPCRTVPAGFLRKPSYGTGFGAALNIETLVAAAEEKDTPTETPASEVQDKILFMINNLSTANIDAKAVEFTEVLKEQYYPWFGQYMVMKRASIEPNFHDMYLKFLEKVNSRLLNNEIVKATYENCKVLLRSDLIKSSSEERSLLKNLGSWLGKFTIGRNQALRAKEIDPKVLIIEAYEKGLMIAVIPFTSKILEPCHSSLAYKPPNPWTVGILCLLAEIYNLPNLKMNLKFDIEVLFKNLRLDIKGVRPTSLLKDRVREVEGNPDFSNKDTGISQAHGMLEVNPSMVPTTDHAELQAEYTASSHISPNSLVEDDKIGAITVPEHVHSPQGMTQVIPSLSSFSLSQLLKSVPNWDPQMNASSVGSLMQFDSIVQTSMEKAIGEIAPRVTQCSISVASQTAKDLVLKDYALETDVTMIIRAARLMVGNLAGNLAYVTCTEPLRVALSNQIRSLLQPLNFNSESMEQRVQFLTTDNLRHGCQAIKSIASEKAMELIDEQIALVFTPINKQREVVGSAYYDIGSYAHGPLARVPEELRPRPGLISIPQKQVYEDFMRDIWQSTCGNSSSVLPAGPPGLGDCLANSSLPPICVSNSIHQNSDVVLASQVAPGITSAQPFDLIEEETDGSAQFSFSTTHVGPNDRVLQPVAGTKSIASLHASVMPHQLNMAEASRLTKVNIDVGAAVPLSPLFPSTGTALSESSLHARDMGNCKLLTEEISSMFAEWCRTCDIPTTSGTAYTRFISQLQQKGFLKGDDITDWFLRSFMELAVAHYLALEQVQTSDSLPFQSSEFHQLLFGSIDAYAMLVGLVLKHTSVDQGSSILLPKVLQVTVNVIHKDAEKKKTFFNPRPYFRLFVNWFLDLLTPDTILDTANFQVLTFFANALHAVQPVKVPSFSFAWLDLVSHRNFMPKLLTINHPYAWPLFERLLVDLFKFMGPYLKNAGQRQPIQLLYKGTLRMLLILLHDFPEFLCSFHFSFCDLIPHNCIQMRNVILSASPRNIRIPDPQTPNLKIDLLPEMSMAPRILSGIDGALKAKQLKADIDKYIKTRPEGSTFLADLQQTLMVPQNEESVFGTRYDVPLINSVVFYVAMQGIPQLQKKHTVQPAFTQQVTHCPMDIFQGGAALDIFQSLIKNLDEEGRYFFLNAVANQLRFPNSHTHYFSYLLLYLFETNEEIIQEQITRVLLERRIADRPHPWGLLTTFIELVKNPKYDFWNRSFTQHEVKLLLEKVSVMPGGPKDLQGLASGGIRCSSN